MSEPQSELQDFKKHLDEIIENGEKVHKIVCSKEIFDMVCKRLLEIRDKQVDCDNIVLTPNGWQIDFGSGMFAIPVLIKDKELVICCYKNYNVDSKHRYNLSFYTLVSINPVQRKQVFISGQDVKFIIGIKI